jgi:hypothetical protein
VIGGEVTDRASSPLSERAVRNAAVHLADPTELPAGDGAGRAGRAGVAAPSRPALHAAAPRSLGPAAAARRQTP